MKAETEEDSLRSEIVGHAERLVRTIRRARRGDIPPGPADKPADVVLEDDGAAVILHDEEAVVNIQLTDRAE